MPRKFKLTWQSGNNGRRGRWRKKYRGHVYYFDGGRGKSDGEAYATALSEWEELKLKIDREGPKRYQEEYEREIRQWDSVLTWSRKYGDDDMADRAVVNLDSLQKALSAPKPNRVRDEDTFDGQFTLATRSPETAEFYRKIAEQVEVTCESRSFQHLPGYEEYKAATDEFLRGIIGSDNVPVKSVLPSADDELSLVDPLTIEREIWRDRLDVMRRASAPADETLKAHVASFLRTKGEEVAAGGLSAGRVYALRLHLNHFADWFGGETPVTEINGKTLVDYRQELLRQVDGGAWSRTTAKDRLNSIKSLIRWMWQIEAIPSLPRIMDGRSNALNIGGTPPQIVVFTKQEITTLLTKASARTKLYIMLMLNCGMTQKDIADLDLSEIDWDAGRIRRKRSKTREHENVPFVNYSLWPETLNLLAQERNPSEAGMVLLNEKGGPLWTDRIDPEGGYKKNDNVKSAFDRLRRKSDIQKPLKALKKTSATLLRGNKRFASLEHHFLGHAAGNVAHRHYALPPDDLLDEAVTWLRSEYGIADLAGIKRNSQASE